MTFGALVAYIYDPRLPGEHKAELAAWLLRVVLDGRSGVA